MKTCPKCGASNYPAQLYCGACGASLSAYAAPQVSVPKTSPPAKKVMTAAEVEAAFNYEPLIKAYYWILGVSGLVLVWVIEDPGSRAGLYSIMTLPMVVAGVVVLVLMWQNANLLRDADPLGRRNLLGIIGLIFLLPSLVAAFSSHGAIVPFLLTCIDLALLCARDYVIAKKYPSRFAILRGSTVVVWWLINLLVSATK